MELSSLIEEFIRSYGPISIFLIVALEYANVPLPSEVILPLVGILALKFNMNLFMVILISVLGGVFGSIINYYLGYKFGNPLLYFLKSKYPKTKKAIKESYRCMTKYDKASVMLSRLVPVARTLISIVAGVTRMNVVLFTLYSAIGITVWNTFLISMGYIVGDNMDLIAKILRNYSITIAIMLAIVCVVGFVIYVKKIRAKKR